VRRKAERTLDKKKLTVFQKELKKARNKCTQIANNAKRAHIQDELTAAASSQRKTFQVVGKLAGTDEPCPVLPEMERKEASDCLSNYFKDKILSIRQNMPVSVAPSSREFHGSLLHDFTPITADDLMALIKKSNKTTAEVDPIPTKLLMDCLDILLPIIMKIINSSLKSGFVPAPLKRAVIRPLLKKTGLDANQPKNYRPVSNLPYISKLLERVVANKLVFLLDENETLDQFQSAYRPGFSTETALLRVTNDLLCSADRGDVSMLLLLDLSAAFDTIDHNILLDRLKCEAGVTSVCLDWFKSYLEDRWQFVSVNGISSEDVGLQYGVPQGSVLGPILFCIYTAQLGDIINDCGIDRQLFADDTGVYNSFSPDEKSLATGVKKLEDCCLKIKNWMSLNKLKLNDEKTEAIVCGKPSSLQKIATPTISIGDHEIKASVAVKNLGLTFDDELSFHDHVSSVVQVCNYKLRQFGRIRPFLTYEAAKTVAVALIQSKLDYCNSCLWGISDCEIHRLQIVQNTAARIVTRTRKREHISPVLEDLHWLPIEKRIDHKVLSLAYRCLNNSAPPYLSDLVKEHKLQTNMVLRSSSKSLLYVPNKNEGAKNVRHGQRAFASAAPKLWNNIPVTLKKEESVPKFKRSLKTHLFSS
jgi:hypothetical protein